jgi:hypothetical protein
MKMRKSSYELDLSDPAIERRLGGEGAPFPSTIEEAAYLLVGLEPPTMDRVPKNLKAKAFLDRQGHLLYHSLSAAIASSALKDLDLLSLCAWAEREKLSKNVSKFLLPTDLAQQIQDVRNRRAPKSAKLAALVGKVASGILSAKRGPGGKDYDRDARILMACDNYLLGNPNNRIHEFTRSQMFQEALHGDESPGQSTLRRLIGPKFKNRSAGNPKSKY